MNNLKFNNFIKKLKRSHEVDLSIEEKQKLRKYFLREVDIHDSFKVPIKSPFSNWAIMNWSSKIKVVLASFLLTVLVGGGVVFAAEYSLPGDILYPVKTQVTEKVARLLSNRSSETKEKFEINLVKERLLEAEQLDKNKDLNAHNEQKIKKQVIDQTIRAEKVIHDQVKDLDKKKNNVEDSSILVPIKLDKNKESEKTETKINPRVFKKEETHKTDSIIKNISNKKIEHDQDETSKSSQDSLEKVLEQHKNILNKLDLGL